MKKNNLFIVIFLIVLAGFLASGCDQQLPNFSNSTFMISGKVYEYDYLRGVSDRDKLLEGALVSIAGETSSATATASGGAYSFSGLALGKYTITVSKEGYQKNGKLNYSVAYDFSSPAIADSTQVVDLSLDPRPVFLGASLEDYQELATTAASFEIYFSEAMSKESVTAFVKKVGLRSASLSQQSISGTSLSWEADGQTLVLTLSQSLDADALYQIGIACSNSGFGIEGIRDLNGQPIYGTQSTDNDIYNSSTDTYYGTYLYVPFKTVSDKTAVPAAPADLVARPSVSGTSEVDYDSVYASTSGVALSFSAPGGANGYKLYVSGGGVNYSLAKTFNSPSVFVFVSDVVSALGSQVACGYDSYGYPIEPGLPWPFLGAGIYLKVSAYNSLGESALSSPLLVVDTQSPSADAVVVSESGTVKVIKFSEPLDRDSAEQTANYVLQGAGPPTIESVSLINDFTGLLLPYNKTHVKFVISSAEAGRTIRINGVKDLSGNTIAGDTDVSY